MSIRNRELSQFGSFVYIDDATKTVGIATTATPYVGIGTTNATAKLTVIGDTNVSGIISATGYYLNGNELVDAAIQTWEINGSDIYRSSGNVGIGSSIPGSKLTVAGDITATGAITGSNVSVGGITTASRFVSTVASGTAPLTVNSTTQVFNLNASLLAGKTPPAGDIVGTSDSQTLTNKTLTSPIISSIVNGAFTSTIPSVNGTLVSTGSTGTVTSNMIADLNIVNADVATNAGITYEKLSLSNSITNADVATNAGITYGKLSLSNSITNADIVTGAGISVSKLSESTISGITLGSNLATLTFGTYLTGTSYNGSAAVTIATNATSANTTSTIVARDGSGNFSAGTITATSFVGNVTGNVTGTATTATNATNINISGITSTGTLTSIVLVANQSTGNQSPFIDSGLSYNASTNTLTASTFSGALSGTATTATTATTANALNTANNYQVNSFGVNTAASGTAGEIRATGNITAYFSDDRLKTKLGNIENALEKVCTLNGFYYEASEVAQELGYEVKREVGVSAQEVEKILPEIVTNAPIDENYKTIYYERLIPLLIESIKELKDELDLTKFKIN